MAAFLQDLATNDLALVGGNLVLVPTLSEEVAQRLRNAYALWQGEWFLDTNLGVPYFASVLGARDLTTVRQVLRQVAEGVEGVGRVVAFDVALDRPTRSLTVTFQVLTTSGALAAGTTGVA